MANRFWVGGAGTWDSSTTHWASSSGGGSGASAPLSTDDVFFDGSSGGGTVTITGSFGVRNVKSLTCTGFTGKFTASASDQSVIVNVDLNGGNLVIGAAMTFDADVVFVMLATGSVTCNANTIPALTVSAGTTTLQDNCTISGLNATLTGIVGANGIEVDAGTLDLNGKTISAPHIIVAAGAALTMGAGTLTLTGTSATASISSSATVSAASGTVKLTDATSASKTFDGGSHGYGTAWASGAGTGTFIFKGITGTVTFKDDGSSAHTTQLDLGTGTATIGATLSSSGSLELVTGTLTDSGNFAVTLASFLADVGAVALTMGSNTWTLTGSGTVWDISAATSMTFSGASATLKLTDATSASKTVKGGSKLYGTIWCSGAGTGTFILQAASFTLKDDGSSAHTTQLDTVTAILGAALNNSLLTLSLTGPAATFNASGFAVTLAAFIASATAAGLTMGSVTWTLAGTGTVWDLSAASSLTLTATGSTIKLTDASSASKTVKGGSKTYGTIWCSGAGTGSFIIQNATFTFKDDGSSAHTTQLALGTGTATLGADLSNSSLALEIVSGSFVTTGHAVTVASFKADVGAVAVTGDLGKIWTLSGTGIVWDLSAAGAMTFSPPGQIDITDTSAASKTFAGSGKAYNDLYFIGAGTGPYIITGSNSFNVFYIATPPHTLMFADGSTQTATTWSFSGSSAAGNNILESQSGSGTWDIVCTAGVTASYLTLQGSHAHGGTFTADNSFDAGDNLFWIFVRSASDAVYFDSAYTYSGASISTVSGLNWLWGETVGVLADGVDIGDATVTTHGNLTLPGGISASVISLGKRYTSYGKTLRSPQAGNQDGSALGRQMKITTVAADMLNSSGLYVGTPTGTRPIPPAWKQTNDGDLYTGIFPAPIDDSSRNEGVIIFSTDRGYPCTLRALEFGIEGTP